MNAKKILYPTDLSQPLDPALEFASSLAAEADALLYIVHVDDFTDLGVAMGEAAFVYGRSWDDALTQQLRERLAQVAPTKPEVRYEHQYLTGSPVAEILGFAEREEVDMIVMSSHGRTGLSRLLMGSTAEAIMRRAECPVLIVKQPAAAEDESEGEGEPEAEEELAAKNAPQARQQVRK